MRNTITKRRPHHDLVAIKAKFSTVATLEITRKAQESAARLGFGLQDIVDVVQGLRPSDFVSSSPAHSPRIAGVWHDTYRMGWDGVALYIKFAGETIIDVTLVSFKEDGA